jgi:SAM-dependent methyltransferase
LKRCLQCSSVFESSEWKCPGCAWKPPTANGFPAFALELSSGNDGYDASFFERLASLEEGYFWFESRNALLTWALAKYFPAAKSFFEVGCGTGFVLREIGRKFPQMRLVGGEVFESGLQFASKRLPQVELLQIDAKRLPFRGEFDVVGAFDVVEHIEEDEAVLREFFQAVRPGGGIMLTVPQHQFLWSAADDHAHHKRRYRRADLVKKVQTAGFRVELATSYVSLLMPVLLATRLGRGQQDGYSVFREFEIGKLSNRGLMGVLSMERAMIRAGVTFPAGGSLMVVAKKP